MTPAALAALLAAAACLLPGAANTFAARRVRDLLAPAHPTSPPAALVVLGTAAASLAVGPPLALTGLALAWAARLAHRRHTALRAARTVADALPVLCRATAAELRSGAPAPTALARAAEDALPALAAHLRSLAGTARLGTAPPLEAWAALPGAERLRAVGALWSVAAGAGSGLADGLDRIADALTAEHRQHAEVAAQLAGPKASAAVLAALPACGVALAASLGARPVPFFTGTPVGLGCLVAGAGLDAAGLVWVRRLAARASP
jgi:tight adherence protein B